MLIDSDDPGLTEWEKHVLSVIAARIETIARQRCMEPPAEEQGQVNRAGQLTKSSEDFLAGDDVAIDILPSERKTVESKW
jgi:hypothetical protein